MRKVYPTTEVITLWARRLQREATDWTVHFDGQTIFYNNTPLARWSDDGTYVAFNEQPRSKKAREYQQLVRQALAPGVRTTTALL